jgi:ABC-type lipoprotein release transport system permease subunit
LLQGLLFDTSTTDLATYVLMVVVLGGTALAASWIPARRAARVDPMTALRQG